jgi:hypothetical protein
MFKKQLLTLSVIVTAVVFLPMTILLVIGMLPTIVASIADRTPERLKAITVGSLNFAATFPYCIDMVTKGYSTEAAVSLITDPRAIIVMYTGALAGYIIELGLASTVAGVMVKQARVRLKKIRTEQERLVERWGREVTGDIPVDKSGFPVETPEQN